MHNDTQSKSISTPSALIAETCNKIKAELEALAIEKYGRDDSTVDKRTAFIQEQFALINMFVRTSPPSKEDIEKRIWRLASDLKRNISDAVHEITNAYLAKIRAVDKPLKDVLTSLGCNKDRAKFRKWDPVLLYRLRMQVWNAVIAEGQMSNSTCELITNDRMYEILNYVENDIDRTVMYSDKIERLIRTLKEPNRPMSPADMIARYRAECKATQEKADAAAYEHDVAKLKIDAFDKINKMLDEGCFEERSVELITEIFAVANLRIILQGVK